MQLSLVLALSAAGLAQANIHGAALLRRHLEAFPARATPVSDSQQPPSPQCVSEALSIATSLPTPAPALLSEIENNAPADASDLCHFSVPSSLSADLSSYAGSLSSWADAHMTELLDFGKTCGSQGSADYSSLLAQCTPAAGADASPTKLGGPSRISASATPTATPTAEASGHPISGSNSTLPVKTNGAGQTGASAFLLAAAGFAVLAL